MFQPERKGKVTPCRCTENRKDMGTSSVESGVRNLEDSSSSPIKKRESCIISELLVCSQVFRDDSVFPSAGIHLS